MAGASVNIQNKILTGAGVVPTIPTPSDITPDNVAWVNATDILIGQIAFNRTDNIWYYRDGEETILEFESGGSGAVSSVFGRNGAVVAEAGDYDALKITFDNSGTDITATDVQGAIEELDSELAAVEQKADQNELDILDKADKGGNNNTVFENTKTETFAASVDFNMNLRTSFDIIITGNIALNPINLTKGQVFLLDGLINTGTPPTITPAANLKPINDAQDFPTANGDRFQLVGYCDGTNIYYNINPTSA